MSDEHSHESESTVNKTLSNIVLLGIPTALVVMLGVTGAAFVKGMGKAGSASEPAAPTVAAASGAPVATPGTPAAPAATSGGSGSPAPEGIEQAVWVKGEKAYRTCAACHGPDGKGFKAGPSLMAPSLIGSETLLGDPNQPILVVLKGIKKETFDYAGIMAALGALPDDQIAAVLTYLRNNWGNRATAITTEQVAEVRAKSADINEPAGIPRAKLPEILESLQ